MLEMARRSFTGIAFTVTVSSGLLTIMVERFLYRRRKYNREATITAVLGWSYVIGGTLAYLLLLMISQ